MKENQSITKDFDKHRASCIFRLTVIIYLIYDWPFIKSCSQNRKNKEKE